MHKAAEFLNRRDFLRAGFWETALAVLPLGGLLSYPPAPERDYTRKIHSQYDPEKSMLEQLLRTYGGELGGCTVFKEER